MATRCMLYVQIKHAIFHVYRRVWLPHLGQCLRAEREHENAEDCFVIAVREHSDTRADDDKPIVGHLPRELSKLLWYFLLHGGVNDGIRDTMQGHTTWMEENCSQGKRIAREES